jgi:hypothetical protein
MTPTGVYLDRDRERRKIRVFVEALTLPQRRRKNPGLMPMKKDVIKQVVFSEMSLAF